MTTISTSRPSRARRWLASAAVTLVLALTLLAFGLSYSVLQDLAARSGVPAEVTWAWPLIVDGTIVVTMVVIFAQRGRGRRANALPWTALVIFALISVVGNGIHTAAVHDEAQGIAMAVAIAVGAVPPIALLVASEMLVRLLAAYNEPATHVVEAVAMPTSQPEAIQDCVGMVASEVTPAVVEPAVSPAHVMTEMESVVAEEATVVPVPDSVAAEAEQGDSSIHRSDNETRATDVANDSEIIEPTALSVPVIPLHHAPQTAMSKPERIEWIIAQAHAGHELSAETLAEQLKMSTRSVQRDMKLAREKAPEAFAEAVATRDLMPVS